MELQRKARKTLDEWLLKKNRKPLVVYGARQVGKTHLILNQFAAESFPGNRHARIDFSIEKDAVRVFREASSIQEILDFLAARHGYTPDGSHLLILDETQECLRSLSLLKQFSEERPDLPVVLTGSMVRLALLRRPNEGGGFLYPVGKVSELRLHPLTFDEFLMNRDPSLHERFLSFDWAAPVLPGYLSEKAQSLYEEFLLVGGMPEAISRFMDGIEEMNRTGNSTRFNALGEGLAALKEIWSSYLNDMDLYQVSRATLLRTRMLFSALPSLLNRAHPNFHASAIEKGKRTRDFESAIQWLLEAGLLLRSDRVKERALLPLLAEDPGFFRLYYADMGIYSLSEGISPSALFVPGRSAFSGSFYENEAAIELRARGLPLFFWEGKRNAELEFLLSFQGKLIPVDVKRTGGSMGSLNDFRLHNHDDFALKVTASSCGWNKEHRLLTIPHFLFPYFLDALEEGKVSCPGIPQAPGIQDAFASGR